MFQHFLGLESLVPGEDQVFLLLAEVILDVALCTNVASHLLTRRHLVHVIILDTLFRFERFDALDESGPGDSQSHRFGIVAVDTGLTFFQGALMALARVTVLFIEIHGIEIVAVSAFP